MKKIVAAALISAGILVLAGCGIAAAQPQAQTPAAPSPVSTAATISGTCTFGGASWALSSDQYGPWHPGVPYSVVDKNAYASETIAPVLGYVVDLKNTSSSTADVTGFSVVFYDSAGSEVGSDSEQAVPELIVPGQSLTWTELSSTTTGGTDAGTGAGTDSQIPASATSCQFAQWSTGQ